jgi:hypothetical protein
LFFIRSKKTCSNESKKIGKIQDLEMEIWWVSSYIS